MEFALGAREISELGMLLLQLRDQSHMIYMPIGVCSNLLQTSANGEFCRLQYPIGNLLHCAIRGLETV